MRKAASSCFAPKAPGRAGSRGALAAAMGAVLPLVREKSFPLRRRLFHSLSIYWKRLRSLQARPPAQTPGTAGL